MEILVVRHGQSVADIECRMEGRADFALSELGEKQAQRAAEWIKEHYKIDVIISSPLKRAAKTAKFISKATGKDIIFDDALMEWDNGLLAGLYRAEANEKYPLPEGGRKLHDDFAQAESFINLRARAETFWSKLAHKYEKEGNKFRICLVSHGLLINNLFASFMMLPLNAEYSINSGDTGIHLWRIYDGQKQIAFLNKQEHLLGLYDSKQ
jgi:2,3-bisphosphoglycerate-dependent phosphoglycerate mutase